MQLSIANMFQLKICRQCYLTGYSCKDHFVSHSSRDNINRMPRRQTLATHIPKNQSMFSIIRHLLFLGILIDSFIFTDRKPNAGSCWLFWVVDCVECKNTINTGCVSVCLCACMRISDGTTAAQNSFTMHTWIHKEHTNKCNIWHDLVKMRKLNNFQCNVMKCNFISTRVAAILKIYSMHIQLT